MLTIIILAIYLIGMLAIGLYLKNRVDSSEDYYVAGRGLPWYLVIMTMAATYIGAGATLADTGLAYDQGVSMFIATLVTMAAMFLFGLISPRVNKIGFKYDIISVSGLVSWRFGKWPGFFSAIIVVWALTGTLAGQVSGSATVIPLIFSNVGVNLSYETAAIVMTLVMVAYTCLAGMYGVAWTDFIQCIILVLGMAVVLPALMINEAGGWSDMLAALPEGHLDWTPGPYVISLAFTYLLYFFAGPPYWQRAFSSNSPKTSRIGAIGGVAVILFYSVMILILGLAAKAIMPVKPEGMESQGVVVAIMCDLFHPVIAAIICCAILAAIMSTMSGYLLTAVQAIVTDIIKVFKKIDDKSELKLAKWLVVAVGVVCLLVALYIQAILDILLMAWGFYSASMAASVVAAVFWKKATAAGSLASIFGGVIVYFFWNYGLGSPGGFDASIVAGLSSIALMIIISLATCRSHPTRMFEGVGKNDPVVKGAKAG